MKTFIRTLIITMVLFIVPLSIYGHPSGEQEQLFYYAFDKKVPIEKVQGKLMFKKKMNVDKEEIELFIKSYSEKVSFNWFNSDICTVTIDDSLIERTINYLLTLDDIVSARNIYVLSEDKEYFKTHNIEKQPISIGMIDQISIKYRDNVEESVKDSIKEVFGLSEYSRNNVFDLYIAPKNVDIIEISNRLYETGFFIFAYPELICKVSYFDNNAVYPNDPYFQYQVTLHNIGQLFNGHSGTVDADIDAPEAWGLTMGSEEIVIAVIDQGVTSNHPDLPNTRQVRLNGSNFGLGDPNDPSPTGNNNHGNACAGVIAATANNGEGIAGIAPLCKIMPIRNDSSTLPYNMANSIRFAADSGAVIISNSWAYETTCSDFSPEIVAAINYAINHNSMVVFAAGNTANHTVNDSGYVCFPGNNCINGMLTVGASDRYDKQADYSPSSPYIDIVAPSHRAYKFDNIQYTGIPGENLDMWTIDIPGNNGYNPWSSSQGDLFPPGNTLPDSGLNYLSYTGHFGGTSHACPVVAGVAALVLSVNPDLTPQDVCEILINTTDKVGEYSYDNNGRCNQMGYGRVNAEKAVWMACDTTSFINELITNNEYRIVTGCDIYMECDYILNNSLLKVRAKNRVYIGKDLYIDNGSELDIKQY